MNDQSFYVGNPSLCGNLIKKSCNVNGSCHVNEQQTPQVDEQSYELWFYAGIGLSFCVGFLGVLFTYTFSAIRVVWSIDKLCRNYNT